MSVYYAEDFDCVCYIDEKTNNVVIKFYGIPNKHSAELFTEYVMATLGIEYVPISGLERSKMVH